MKRKLHHILIIVFILLIPGCESMLSEHPVDKLQALYESSLALFMAQPNVAVSGSVVLCSLNNTGNPNVQVVISNIFSSHTTYTDSDGNFTFNSVKPGGYTVAASKQGHQFIPESQHISVGGSGLNDVTFETSVTWEKTIGGSGWDKAYSVSQTNDCGYIVAGYSDSDDIGNLDFDIIKLDVNGMIEWDKKFGGTNSEIAYSVIQTTDGGYAAAGYTYSYGAGLNDFWIVKLLSNGNLEWQKAYGGTEWEEARSIRQTADNGFIIAGYTETYGAGSSDFWVIKLDENGNHSWDQTYGSIKSDTAFSILQTDEHEYILCGTTEVGDSGDDDILVIKINDTGEIIWSKTFNKGIDDEANAIAPTSDGGYIITGTAGGSFSNCWILKLKDNGDLEWEQVFGGDYNDKAYSIQQTSDGGYILCGCTYSFTTTDNDMLIVKLDSQGQIQWQRTFDSDEHGEDIAYSISITSDGGFIFAGNTYKYLTKNDIWLHKLNRDGELEQ